MKKSFLLIAMAALMTACGGNKSGATAEAGADAAPEADAVEAAAGETTSPAAAATDAQSIIGFAAEDLKFDDIITDVKVGEIIGGKEVSVIVVPSAAVNANFNAFSKALFDKLKAETGRVGDDTKEERTQPFETDGGISVCVYSYKVDGHDVYCSFSNTGGESGKDYELIFTKY